MKRPVAVRRLFVIWAAIAAPIMILMTAVSISGGYDEDTSSAWSWLLLQISPVLSLLVAAVFSSPSRHWKAEDVDPFKWRCALWSSSAQGAGMLATMIAEPFSTMNAVELFDATGIGLALLQGVVVAAVGAVIFDGR